MNNKEQRDLDLVRQHDRTWFTYSSHGSVLFLKRRVSKATALASKVPGEGH